MPATPLARKSALSPTQEPAQEPIQDTLLAPAQESIPATISALQSASALAKLVSRIAKIYTNKQEYFFKGPGHYGEKAHDRRNVPPGIEL